MFSNSQIKSITGLKIELLCRGVKAESGIDLGRVGGAGPAGGRYIFFPRHGKNAIVNTPFQGFFISSSPYYVKKVKDSYPFGEYMLYMDTKPLTKIFMVEKLKFLDNKTSDGIPFWKIVAVHGFDVVAATINKYCFYWFEGKECGFCAIQQNIKRHNKKILSVKNPKHITEAILEAEKNNFCKHVTLTSGSINTPDRGCKLYIPFLKEIKKATNIPVHVQIEPPKNLSDIEKLYEVGADTIGIHIESLDENVRKNICPGKASITMEEYFKAWKKALEVFGENQVDSMILVGLGEDQITFSRMLNDVCALGVIPLIIPFRPLPATKMEKHPPPNPNYVLKILEHTISAIRQYGLRLELNKAGCVRCGACSPLKEALTYGL